MTKTASNLPAYPGKTYPCNGCGMCCLIEPCPASLEVFGANSQVCPALEFEEGRYWCGLMRHPEQHGATLPELEAIAPGASTQYHKALIGADVGCDSDPVDFNSYWSVSSDGEHFYDRYYSREDAIEQGRKSNPEGFWLGLATDPSQLSEGVWADDVVDLAQEFLDGWDIEEAADFKPSKEVMDDLQQRLRAAVDEWVAVHGLTPKWFVVNDAEWIDPHAE